MADLYGVTTKALNQAVKRNLERFPADFAFFLTEIEKAEVVTYCDHLVLQRIMRILDPPPGPRPEIGFHVKAEAVPYRTKRKAPASSPTPQSQRARARSALRIAAPDLAVGL